MFATQGVYYALEKLKQVKCLPTPTDKEIVNVVLKYLSNKDKVSTTFMADLALRWKDLKIWTTVITKGSMPQSSVQKGWF